MARQVYAHYMVGLTDGQSAAQWTKDIKDAKAVGIDGFALNMGAKDNWTLTQVHQAYTAAEANNFKMFLSFDMGDPTKQWDVSQVVNLINDYKNSAAQVNVGNKPLVSTFEGPNWAGNWETVRHQTGGIHLQPDWSSLGPYGIKDKLSLIDGAFSWAAFPKANQQKLTTEEDLLYKSVLGNKPYMMGVAPWFYVNLPNWSKNWYSSSESLWYDRWQQVLDILPDAVEIITWNDFSESSYIGDIVGAQIVAGANGYVNGFDHSAYRSVLPYFIKAYKAGQKNVDLPFDPTAIAWYRTTPKNIGSDGGTVWGLGGSQSAANGAKDVVSIMTLTVGDTDIKVCIGNSCENYHASAANRANYFEMPFNGRTGAVVLTMNEKTTTGPAISHDLPLGHVNFNAVAIRL